MLTLAIVKKKLLEPVSMAGYRLSNRVFMAPLTRSRADNREHAPTDLHVEYYRQRAFAGLIISEGTVVSQEGVGYVNVPGIYTQAQTEDWKKVTHAVHSEGGHFFMQLWHVGRVSHPDFQKGKIPVAPSAIDPEGHSLTPNGKKRMVIPRELTSGDIQRIIGDFTKAGENAIKAGCDGVEIHAANGYLFHQFFVNSSNRRTDRYGGSDENKARFLFEVIDAMAARIPVEKIGIRLKPMMDGYVGIHVDEETASTFDHIVNRLNDYPIAYLHLVRPRTPVEKPGAIKDVIGHYRELYNGFLVAAAHYEPDTAEEEIRSGRADAIAFGRYFIANPDLPHRIANDYPLVKPDSATYYTTGPEGYTDYPTYK